MKLHHYKLCPNHYDASGGSLLAMHLSFIQQLYYRPIVTRCTETNLYYFTMKSPCAVFISQNISLSPYHDLVLWMCIVTVTVNVYPFCSNWNMLFILLFLYFDRPCGKNKHNILMAFKPSYISIIINSSKQHSWVYALWGCN